MRNNKPVINLALMCFKMGTGADLCFAVNCFSRFRGKQNNEAWKELKRILRYLQETQDCGLWNENKTREIPANSVDADRGIDKTDKKSTSGYN